MKHSGWSLHEARFAVPADVAPPPGGRVYELRANDSAAGGGHLRVAYWQERDPGAHRGTVLLMHGYAEFIEKYFETIEELLARGFGVLTFDWRGQGLSSRLLPDDEQGFHRGYIDSFDQHLNDALLVTEYLDRLVGAERRILIAHSMGGNLGLRLLQAKPGYFERAVLSAPMLGLIGIPTWFVSFVSGVYCRFGRKRFYAWGSKPTNLDAPVNVVTGCEARFDRTQALLRNEPELITSGVTWGWLRAAAQSMGITRKPEFLRSIAEPLLVFTATRDRLVGRVGHKRLVRFAPKVRHVVLQNSMHEPLTEVDAIRQAMWVEIEAFLALDAAPHARP